jgi:hypothetical protein
MIGEPEVMNSQGFCQDFPLMQSVALHRDPPLGSIVHPLNGGGVSLLKNREV